MLRDRRGHLHPSLLKLGAGGIMLAGLLVAADTIHLKAMDLDGGSPPAWFALIALGASGTMWFVRQTIELIRGITGANGHSHKDRDRDRSGPPDGERLASLESQVESLIADMADHRERTEKALAEVRSYIMGKRGPS